MKRALFISRVSLFPTEHGGAKNLRAILQRLTREGVECRVLVRMQPRGMPHQRFLGQSYGTLPDLEDGVRYLAVEGDLATRAREELESFKPDGFFLCDDGLEDARELFKIGRESGKLIFLAQTIHFLPFGPYTMAAEPFVAECLRSSRAILAPSRFVADYIERHLGVRARVFYPPVFGAPPFANLAAFENPYITMINPCPWKGSSIFLAIARARPDLEFAAVPTWGATEPLLKELGELKNVTVLPETSDIDQIFKKTRVLLAPSLCQEAFGLVSPEALLRGIPVLASDVGGLPESTLGVARNIPVTPISFEQRPKMDGHPQLGWVEPKNPILPWLAALDDILASEEAYKKVSLGSRTRAEDFVRSLESQSLQF